LTPSIFAAAMTLATLLVAQSAPPRTRSVYLSALDSKGAPVKDLTAADLSIKEEGKSRTVLSVGPAATKMAITMLVDDGGVGLNDIRTGIAAFMNRLLPGADFSVVGISEQNRTFVEFTNEGNRLAAAIQQLRARNVNGGGHLLEAVLDAITVSEKKEVLRPIVVVVTNQAREYGEPNPDPVMQALARSGTAIYALEVLRRSGSSRTSAGGFDAMAQGAHDNEAADADPARAKILGDGPRETGGRREELLNTADVPATLNAIADDLANQYVLVYATEAGADASPKIAVGTTRKNVKLRVPTRAASRGGRE